MEQRNAPKIVTVDEGQGPVQAVKDSSGRILTREQVATIRDRQQADLEKISALKDKLAAGDAAATAEAVGQVKDRLSQRLAMMDRQKAELQGTLARLNAGDGQAIADVVGRTARQLGQRAETIARSRDRSAALLAELDAPAGE